MKIITKSLIVDAAGCAATAGHLLLRVVAAGMIFYIHGWHKLEGCIAYVQQGTPWPLLKEIGEMHFPAPFPSAVAATIVQFICPLFIAVGLFTRLNALFLTGVLSVALLQNLLANRDPQLAILYLLVTTTILLMGGGRFSLDARLVSRLSHPAGLSPKEVQAVTIL